jgi:hypothetical protein
MPESVFNTVPDVDGESRPSRLMPKVCFTTEENDETTQSFYEAEDVFVSKGSKLTWHITERRHKYYMTFS